MFSDKDKITLQTWNKLAQLYEDKFMHLTYYNESYDCLCAAINNSKATILELGCGPGNITKYLLEKNPDYKILGTDISTNMITLAQKNNPTASFQLLDAREILSLNQTFDAIVNGFCLPYLSAEAADTLIQHCNQLLNNNGILYMSFVEGAYEDSGFKTSSTGDAAYFYYYNLTKLQNTLLTQGFIVKRVLYVDYPIKEKQTEKHTIIIAQKKV